MKALLLSAYKQLQLVEMPRPEPEPRDLLVRVAACGICGSDVHGYDGSTGRRIPPIVMGHEAAGVVEQVGAEVSGFKPGDRVTFDSTVSCGTCHYCRAGRINLCDRRRVLGVSCGDYRQHGAFAEYVVVPEIVAYRLPDSLSFEAAAMVEPVSIAIHAASLAKIALGESVVVVGAGMIGLLVIQAARLAGCGRLIAVDLDARKLELAKELGASDAILATDPTLRQRVLELTGGRGADAAFEVVGATAPLQTAIDSVRKGSRIVLVGNLSPKVELPLQSIVTREIALLGSCASNGEYPTCIDLMASGRMNVRKLMSAVAPLSEGPVWFERLYSGKEGLMKVILKPDGTH